MKFLAVLLLTIALPLTAACAKSGASGGQASLQGTWETIRMVTNDKETPAESIRKDITVTFEGDKMITRRKGKVVATWTYTLEDTQNPKQMIVNTGEPGGKERLSYLIYKIEGNTLTTCSGSRSFPKEFTTKTEQGCYLTVRRRVRE